MSEAKSVFEGAQADMSSHKKNIEVLESLTSLAKLHNSTADMGAEFLDAAGGDYEKAKERIKNIADVLKQIAYEWLLATRLEYTEKQGEKK